MFLCWAMWMGAEINNMGRVAAGLARNGLGSIYPKNIHLGDWILRNTDISRLKYTQLWITSSDWLGSDVCRLKYGRAALTCVRFTTSQLGMGEKYWLLYISSLIEEANFPTTDCRAWSQSVENGNHVFLTINVLCFHKLCSKDFLSLEELWKWMEITISIDIFILQFSHVFEADNIGLKWKPNSFPD